MTTDRGQLLANLHELARHDPGGRGLARWALAGECGPATESASLAAAARSLANTAGHVGIVTGFVTFSAGQPTAETDGPPGALFLARVLLELGYTVTLITDSYGVPILTAGCDHWNLGQEQITEFPFEIGTPDAEARKSNEAAHNRQTDAWVRSYLDSPAGARLTHLIAVERPGPSHTLESLKLQNRQGPPPVDRFQREVPPASRNVCHNMRGESINAYTAKTHRLFEKIAFKESVTTIGLGDGGNEIGMGNFAWQLLADAVPGGRGGLIACRIRTDLTITAGTSNWAAYALAIGTCVSRNRLDVLRPLDVASQQWLIECLVHDGGAADGVTGRREATVDGLTAETYFRCLGNLRSAVGLRP